MNKETKNSDSGVDATSEMVYFDVDTAVRPEPEMLEEYDFSQGLRGKYADRYHQGTNIVLISPDVAEVFSNSKAVNEALRSLIELARRSANSTKGGSTEAV